ncbi:uncharacterized protein LOC114307113 [Camellia sinensis]|uniref:uncharacterized protein LOC114307113 n=1 Tax=Camellia sinensis TaxID=4442 RepID=UPI0010366CCA|nr:uncharacterized protein LOC114307113 [Camellia sinensis]
MSSTSVQQHWNSGMRHNVGMLMKMLMESEARLCDNLENLGKTEKVHHVEEPASTSNKHVVKFPNKKKSFKRKKGNFTKKEFVKKKSFGSCFVCGKKGHYAKDCRHRKGHKNETNMMSTNEDMTAMLTEINMVDMEDGWWIDFDATCHATPNKDVFHSYNEVSSE